MDDAGHILRAAGGGFLGGTRTSGHEETAPVIECCAMPLPS
jgi:hypothetical protein